MPDPQPLQNRSHADIGPWFGQWAARVALRLPPFSPLKLLGPFLRWHLRREGGRHFTANARDGVGLDAMFFPALPHCGSRLPVLLTHGWMEIKEMHMSELKLLRRNGHDVMLLDLRAHGRSGGRLTTIGAWEREDITAVIDQAVELGLIGPKLITMGYSTGAACMIQHAADDPRVAAVVALAPFADLISAIRSFGRLYGNWYDPDILLRGFEQFAQHSGFHLRQSDTIGAMQRMHVPVLVAAGDRDRHLPPPLHAEHLAAAAPDDLCTLHLVKGANHLSIYQRLDPKLSEAIARFCAAASGGSKASGGSGESGADKLEA